MQATRLIFWAKTAAQTAARVRSTGIFIIVAWSIGALADEASPLVDPDDSIWMARFQSTYVWQAKPAFRADYSGPNSLRADAEKSYTVSATAYFGVRLWDGAELYANPEVVQGRPLSDLTGLAGATNGEAQKVSGTNPTLYRARMFLRQTFELGGEKQKLDEGFNQFAETVDSRRVVITVGNFALNDIFDGNAFSHDPRTQFLNWTLIDYGAWDFAADARGFTEGAVVEYYYDAWVLRLALAEMPIDSNGLALNARIFDSNGENAEVERAYSINGEPGKLRLLAYRNVAVMGSYQAADALAAETGSTPNIAAVRTHRAKTGAGVSVEQNITDSLGLFARYSADDGRGEEYAFTEVDRSAQMGLSIKGTAWSRTDDTIGVAAVRNELSSAHRDYLAAGGLGFFLGDGQLTHYHPEDIAEAYYSAKLISGFWATLDYQHINSPAYNADRGPVAVYTARLHAEF